MECAGPRWVCEKVGTRWTGQFLLGELEQNPETVQRVRQYSAAREKYAALSKNDKTDSGTRVAQRIVSAAIHVSTQVCTNWSCRWPHKVEHHHVDLHHGAHDGG